MHLHEISAGLADKNIEHVYVRVSAGAEDTAAIKSVVAALKKAGYTRASCSYADDEDINIDLDGTGSRYFSAHAEDKVFKVVFESERLTRPLIARTKEDCLDDDITDLETFFDEYTRQAIAALKKISAPKPATASVELTAGVLDKIKDFLDPEYVHNEEASELIDTLRKRGKVELKVKDKAMFKRLQEKMKKLGVGFSTSIRDGVIHVMLRNGYSQELDNDSRFSSHYAA